MKPYTVRLNQDVDQVNRMESDLIDKVKKALVRYNLAGEVHGVFSLDDLEGKLASDLCEHIGVGVGLMKIDPSVITLESRAQLNPGGGTAAKVLDYFFSVIMAVPTSGECSERLVATKVLTALRFDIMGSSVAGDTTARTWNFEREMPVVDQSTDTMLYYSQVWRVAMPNVGNLKPAVN